MDRIAALAAEAARIETLQQELKPARVHGDLPPSDSEPLLDSKTTNDIELNQLERTTSDIESRAAQTISMQKGPAVGSAELTHELHFNQLSVYTPDGRRVLCRDLGLTLQPGQSLLIMGRSGCGK